MDNVLSTFRLYTCISERQLNNAKFNDVSCQIRLPRLPFNSDIHCQVGLGNPHNAGAREVKFHDGNVPVPSHVSNVLLHI